MDADRTMSARERESDPLGRVCRAAVRDVAARGRVDATTVRDLVALAGGHAREAELGRPYGRRELFVDDALGEVMLASWRSGATSAAHDHGAARGFVIVVAGRFEERILAREGEALAATNVCNARIFGKGDALVVPASIVHTMACVEAGLTLHVYAGAPGPFRIYDPERRATYLASGGAWLPPDRVLSVEPWDAPAPHPGGSR